MQQRRPIIVEGGEPQHCIRPVQIWANKADEEPDHQQKAQESGVYRRAQPAREQIADGSHQQPQWNHRERGRGQVAPVELQARGCRGHRRSGQRQYRQ